MDVDDYYIINDTREINLFNKLTFSGYLKKDILNGLIGKIDEGNIEGVCVFMAEICVSGYFQDLWERIILYYAKYININSPFLPFHIFQRLNVFIRATQNKNNILELRNCQNTRNHFCELLCILTNATKKRKNIILPKIVNSDFDQNIFNSRLKAQNYSSQLENILHDDDPKEMKVIINEILHNLSNLKFKINNIYYWISWLLEWEKKNIKKFGKYECSRRNINDIEEKYKKDFIWVLWEIIIKESINRNNEILEKQVRSLLEFFKYKYTSNKKRKRIFVLITALQFLEPSLNFDQKKYPIYEKYNIILQATGNINTLFRDLKKNENLENSKINSKLKQEATFCITRFENIQTNNSYRKNKEKKNILKDKKKPLTEEKKNVQDKFDILSNIDTLRLNNKSNNKPIYGNNYIQRIEKKTKNNFLKNNKTIDIIKEIDSKIDKKKNNEFKIKKLM